jgi:hypothetical protein
MLLLLLLFWGYGYEAQAQSEYIFFETPPQFDLDILSRVTEPVRNLVQAQNSRRC